MFTQIIAKKVFFRELNGNLFKFIDICCLLVSPMNEELKKNYQQQQQQKCAIDINVDFS